jgi:hypothetical protein
MKRLLVLLLVLGMASMAQAAVSLNISVDMDKDGPQLPIEDPVDSQINVAPSESIWIDIHGLVPSGEYTSVIVQVNGLGELSGGHVALTSVGNISFELMNKEETDPDVEMTWQEIADYFGLGSGLQNSLYMVNLTDTDGVNTPFDDLEGTLIDQIVFHCTGEGDATITVWDWDNSDVENGIPTIYDTLVIHQVPEPMTLSLLGLGGLALLRRRR